MLQPATIKFLAQLKKNNNRTWFDTHREKYLSAKSDFENLVQQLITELGKNDPDIAVLEVKDCVFRIYRDVRFSKDKTPYKNYLAAEMNRGGRKVLYPGLYLHIEPDNLSYCGGGIWHPEKEELKKIRQEIDYNYHEFESVVREKKFKKTFGQLAREDELSRPPKGYTDDNPAVEYLKLKSFIVDTSLSDEEVISKDFVRKISSIYQAMKPFTYFLGKALE